MTQEPDGSDPTARKMAIGLIVIIVVSALLLFAKALLG